MQRLAFNPYAIKNAGLENDTTRGSQATSIFTRKSAVIPLLFPLYLKATLSVVYDVQMRYRYDVQQVRAQI